MGCPRTLVTRRFAACAQLPWVAADATLVLTIKMVKHGVVNHAVLAREAAAALEVGCGAVRCAVSQSGTFECGLMHCPARSQEDWVVHDVRHLFNNSRSERTLVASRRLASPTMPRADQTAAGGDAAAAYPCNATSAAECAGPAAATERGKRGSAGHSPSCPPTSERPASARVAAADSHASGSGVRRVRPRGGEQDDSGSGGS